MGVEVVDSMIAAAVAHTCEHIADEPLVRSGVEQAYAGVHPRFCGDRGAPESDGCQAGQSLTLTTQINRRGEAVRRVARGVEVT